MDFFNCNIPDIENLAFYRELFTKVLFTHFKCRVH